MSKRLLSAGALAVAAVLTAGLGPAVSRAAENPSAATSGFTQEQAVQAALAERPGELIKAYREKKRGQDVWEVQIRGQDGRKWELYYDAETGKRVKAEAD